MRNRSDDTRVDATSIAILFALREELAPLLRLGAFHPRGRRPLRETYTGSFSNSPLPLRVAASGAGCTFASDAVKRLSSVARPSAVIICGFAGALSHSIGVTSLIVPDSVVSHDGRRISPDPHLLSLARSIEINPCQIAGGTLFTSDRILTSVADKCTARTQTSADAVDMETAGAAIAAEEEGIPWIAVRAITDDAGCALPLDFNRLSHPSGEVSLARLLLAVALQPWKVPPLTRLGMHSNRAAHYLAIYLRALTGAIAYEMRE